MGVLVRKFGQSDLDANDVLQEALESEFALMDDDFKVRTLLNLGMVNICKGQLDPAEKHLAEARNLSEKYDMTTLMPWVHKYDGFLALLQSDFKGAYISFKTAADMFHKMGHIHERNNCTSLVICSFGPGLMEQWENMPIDISVRETVEAENQFSELKEHLHRFHSQSFISGDEKAVDIADRIVQMSRLITILQERYDPRPPASLMVE